jgi:arylamine N-acetyltransferase
MSHFVDASRQNASAMLKEFLHRHHIDASLPPRQLLEQVARAFARLPYENLSKIVRAQQTNDLEQSRRLPNEVLGDYYTHGAGGTCFSLTWTLLHLLRSLGYTAEPILADRRYGPNTHSALLVWLEGMPHLLDPGYLLVDAIPLQKQGSLLIPTSFQQVLLQPGEQSGQLQLLTEYEARTTYRLTYKTDPVDTAQFLKAWDESFQFEMMQYPVLSRIVDGQQFYLQKQRLMIRGSAGTQHQEIASEELPKTIQQYFAIDPMLAKQALQHTSPKR